MLDPDPGNNANFYQDGDFTMGTPYGPYMTTEVGAFTNSESPYGTFDQGGNVTEWNEAAVTSSSRGLRGGGWYNSSGILLASYRSGINPTYEYGNVGFRVASVPEPGSITLMLRGALAGLYLWRRRK